MDELRRARRDPAYFAEALLGFPLWEHQRKVVESKARTRAICSGRQAGQSTAVSVAALHTAYAKPGSLTLIVSAGDVASRDLLRTCSSLLANPLLAGSVLDDSKSEIMLSNGSRIRSIPQSERQARGPSVDLLVLDEACWIADEIWTAARFSVIAKKDSRILMASTPWGRLDRFLARAYRAGLSGERGYESFHRPSTVSPLVDAELLDEWRRTDPERIYRSEVLAEWVDDQGAYFSAEELDAATRDYVLGEVHAPAGVCGVDWGFARDASTCVVIASVGQLAERFGCARDALYVPRVEEGFGVPYARWVERVVDVARRYRLRKVVSEQNGVGAMPSQELAARLPGKVLAVHTDNRAKEDAFARVKAMLQQGRLVLPRHPGLLMQLSALEYEISDSGVTKIAMPERVGHDDVAMGRCLAVRADPSFGVARAAGPRVAPRSTRQLRRVQPGARATRSGDNEITFLDGSRRRFGRNDLALRIARDVLGRSRR